MELMLKQRLVGAAVIIALAVVLIPMILDGAGQHLVPDIPQEPAYLKTHSQLPVPRLPSRALVKGKTSNPAKSGEKVVSIAAPGKVSKAPAHPSDARQHRSVSVKRIEQSSIKVAKLGLARAPTVIKRSRKKIDPKLINSNPTRRNSVYQTIKVWSVQIASFKSPVNARILKRKLSKAGFKVYIFRTRTSKNRQAVYRVRIGPESSHSKAREVLAKIRNKVRLNGYITSHK